jgi:hypothetical protein
MRITAITRTLQPGIVPGMNLSKATPAASAVRPVLTQAA